jgi:hypothetical protein
MNIKRTLLTILFLTICTIGIAQDYKENIKSEFTEYLNALVNKEFEKSFEYIAPEFFEIVPKSQMIKLMEQTFNNPTMEIEIKNPKILTINDSEIIENKYYSQLTYSNQMNFKMNSEEEETDDEKKNENKFDKTII